MSGKLIVIDGCDGSGKSGLIQILRGRLGLNGVDAVFTRQPGGGDPLCAKLREIVKSREYDIDKLSERFLFAADHAQFLAKFLIPNLQAGRTVISDRFSQVTDLVYGTASGMRLEDLQAIHDLYPSVRVDLLIVVRVESHTALERKAMEHPSHYGQDPNCRIELKGLEFLKAVANAYNSIEEWNQIGEPPPTKLGYKSLQGAVQLNCRRIRCVDNNGEFETTKDRISDLVGEELGRRDIHE